MNIDGIFYDVWADFEKETPSDTAFAKVSALCAPAKARDQVTNQYEGHFAQTLSLDQFYDDPKAAKKSVIAGQELEFLRVKSLIITKLNDYVTKPCWLSKIFRLVRWKPALDLACNPIGSNAVAPLFISAMVDALRSGRYIKGKRLMVNPIFVLIRQYKALLEQAFTDDPTTRAIFVVPDRPKKEWFQELLASDHWHIVCHVPAENPMFTGVNKKESLNPEGRKKFAKNYERIIVFEMRREPPCYDTMAYEMIQRMDEETFDYHHRIGSPFLIKGQATAPPLRPREAKMQRKAEGKSEPPIGTVDVNDTYDKSAHRRAPCERCGKMQRPYLMQTHLEKHCFQHFCEYCSL